jgi:hypothetical protein
VTVLSGHSCSGHPMITVHLHESFGAALTVSSTGNAKRRGPAKQPSVNKWGVCAWIPPTAHDPVGTCEKGVLHYLPVPVALSCSWDAWLWPLDDCLPHQPHLPRMLPGTIPEGSTSPGLLVLALPGTNPERTQWPLGTLTLKFTAHLSYWGAESSFL